jgi:hypothetical protein
VQNLAAPMQFQDRPSGNCVLRIIHVRQPHQDACIKEECHQS